VVADAMRERISDLANSSAAARDAFRIGGLTTDQRLARAEPATLRCSLPRRALRGNVRVSTRPRCTVEKRQYYWAGAGRLQIALSWLIISAAAAQPKALPMRSTLRSAR
jgi:hypothetical protein